MRPQSNVPVLTHVYSYLVREYRQNGVGAVGTIRGPEKPKNIEKFTPVDVGVFTRA